MDINSIDILKELKEPWRCIPCGEHNTPYSLYCWKCGRGRFNATDQYRWEKFFEETEICDKCKIPFPRKDMIASISKWYCTDCRDDLYYSL